MIKSYIDASTKGNPGPSGGGIVLLGEDIYEQESFALTQLTNHQAEFAVFSHLLDILYKRDLHTQTILVYTDSKILAQTVQKDYTKNRDFKKYLVEIQEKLTNFPLLLIEWVPESKNKGADHLARQGLQKALQLEDR
ncbi:MAG: ribonuclease HI family protein [Tetragenococcus halophilus]|uniref:Reverse transcriptase-like protein n=2 Tax=Tetragenococcus halophilus TaxID=51669 RepID=A0A3G5FJC6_TETHA|nr:ribonuclease HI family protein [Tetragenococcus halophilus]AYW50409.1 ribonuclease HI [Tetragenococcus halophilus]MCF1601160.1 ribonuclease HI family protein [Tetragenococcus halophilus]MCF1675953.1 ribonuclease HI family protein [Tetragenococcus halophilus]MCO8285709.1 ribonuclease HI family protein [Tetragenococcus halophilus]MCO8287816.1 ribonuclease HI family protein [Tetragenococcus halophilus]